jgi:hypothetical protein
MIMRETILPFSVEAKALISYPIQWSGKPQMKVLDLVVTKYYLFFVDGKRIRLFRYGKCETVEGDLGKKLSWRETLPKAE